MVTPTQRESKLIELLTNKYNIGGFWEMINIIMSYLYSHPIYKQEMLDIELACKEARETNLNVWGSNKGKDFRRLGMLPNRINLFVKRVYEERPPMGYDKFLLGFYKRYPQFLTCEKI